MPPCNECVSPACCETVCQAYAEQLRQCRDSGQMTAAQTHAHEQAGEFGAPMEIGPLEDVHGVIAGNQEGA